MKYHSQGLAFPYFIAALTLFLVQVWLAYCRHCLRISNFLSEAVPFHIFRMIYTNALLVWLLLGYFGASYF
jgi:nitric oxide reductase subunit B